MMMENYDDLDRKISKLITRAENTSNENELFKAIRNQILQSIDFKRGKVQISKENIRKIIRIKGKLGDTILRSDYRIIIKSFLAEMPELAGLVDEYFKNIVPRYNKSNQLLDRLLSLYEDKVLDRLTGVGLARNLTDRVGEMMLDSMTKGTSLADLNSRLKELIVNDERVKQVIRTAEEPVNEFVRNYTKDTADRLGLKHYLYAGTIKNNTRDFCDRRVGNVYSEDEIKSWASKDWAGKDPNTTEANIFFLLGGHRCRHYLQPITEDEYKRRRGE